MKLFEEYQLLIIAVFNMINLKDIEQKRQNYISCIEQIKKLWDLTYMEEK